jgi:hypothetical protein
MTSTIPACATITVMAQCLVSFTEQLLAQSSISAEAEGP